MSDAISKQRTKAATAIKKYKANPTRSNYTTMAVEVGRLKKLGWTPKKK